MVRGLRSDAAVYRGHGCLGFNAPGTLGCHHRCCQPEYVHHQDYGPGSDKYQPDAAHEDSAQDHENQHAHVVVVVLNICGLGRRRITLFTSLLADFPDRGKLLQSLVGLATFAYFVFAGLAWHLLCPPVYSFEQYAGSSPPNCSTRCRLGSLSTRQRVCSRRSQEKLGFPLATASQRGDTRRLARDWYPCVLTSADYRLRPSVGQQWLPWQCHAVGRSFSHHTSKDTFANKPKSQQEKEAELNQQKSTPIRRRDEYTSAILHEFRDCHRRFRSISLIIVVWAFAITHSTTKPRVNHVSIFASVLAFCLAYLKLSHKLHQPAQRNLLRVLWACLSAVIILFGILEYAYTLQFARAGLDTILFDKLKLTDGNALSQRYRDCNPTFWVLRRRRTRLVKTAPLVSGVFLHAGYQWFVCVHWCDKFHKMYGPRKTLRQLLKMRNGRSQLDEQELRPGATTLVELTKLSG